MVLLVLGQSRLRRGLGQRMWAHRLRTIPKSAELVIEASHLLATLPIHSKPTGAFNKRSRRKEERGFWTARGHHLCINDTYDPEYVFQWKGAELESWTMAYTVKGPGKDYYIHSRFSRPGRE